MDVKTLPAERVGAFMDEYPGFFDSRGKQVAFVTGILVSKILQFQGGTNAFRKELGDYRFDVRKLQVPEPVREVAPRQGTQASAGGKPGLDAS